MGLLEDAERIVEADFGSNVAAQLSTFDNPDKFPKDFLDDCVFFIGLLIGEDAAKRKFAPLYAKYVKNRKMAAKGS